MLFWSLDSLENLEEKTSIKNWSWFTLLILLVSASFFYWHSNGLKNKQNSIDKAQKTFYCYYVKHHYLHIPTNKRVLLTSFLRKYNNKIELIVDTYNRDIRIRKRIDKLLHGDDWSSPVYLQSPKSDDKVKCLEGTQDKNLIKNISKTKIYIELAKSGKAKIAREQKSLNKRIASLEKAQALHPHYRWGQIPAKHRLLPLLSSLFMYGSLFILIWQLVIFWFVGGVLERRLGGFLLLILFLVSGILGNVFSWYFLPEMNVPLLGAAFSLSGMMGIWLVLYHFSNIRLVVGLPFTSLQYRFPFPAIIFLISWFLLEFYTHLLFLKESLNVLIPVGLNFIIFVVIAFILRALNLLRNVGEEELQFTAPIIKKSRSQAKNLESPTKKRLEEAKQATQKGLHKRAVEIYREITQKGKHPFSTYYALMTACRNAKIIPESNEFLQTIHVATQESVYTKTQEYYQNFIEHYDAKPMSARSRLNLANDLKRAQLQKEALTQSYEIVKKGTDNPFYIQAFLLWSEVLLDEIESKKTSHDKEKLLNISRELQAANHDLHLYPEYKESLDKTEKRIQKLLPEDFEIPNYLEINHSIAIKETHSIAEEELFAALDNIGKEHSWDNLPGINSKKISESMESNIFGADFETWSGEWELNVDQYVIRQPSEDDIPIIKGLPEVERIVATTDLLENLMSQPWKMEENLQDAVIQENVLTLSEEFVEEYDPYLGQLEPVIGTLIEEPPESQPLTPSHQKMPVHSQLYPHVNNENLSFDVDDWSDEWDLLIGETQHASQENLQAYQEQEFIDLQKPRNVDRFEQMDRIVTSPDMLLDLMSEPWKMENSLQHAVAKEQATVLEHHQFDEELDLVLGVLIEDEHSYNSYKSSAYNTIKTSLSTKNSTLTASYPTTQTTGYPRNPTATYQSIKNRRSTNSFSEMPRKIDAHLAISQQPYMNPLRQELTTMELSSPLAPTDLNALLPNESNDSNKQSQKIMEKRTRPFPLTPRPQSQNDTEQLSKNIPNPVDPLSLLPKHQNNK